MTNLTIYIIRSMIWLMEMMEELEVTNFYCEKDTLHRALEKLVFGQVYFGPLPMIRPKLEVKP